MVELLSEEELRQMKIKSEICSILREKARYHIIYYIRRVLSSERGPQMELEALCSRDVGDPVRLGDVELWIDADYLGVGDVMEMEPTLFTVRFKTGNRDVLRKFGPFSGLFVNWNWPEVKLQEEIAKRVGGQAP